MKEHSSQQLEYPDSPREDVIEVLHGVEVSDPYRWLEELDSEPAQDWVQAQNRLTFAYLDQIGVRERIHGRFTELWNYEKYLVTVGQHRVPIKRGGRYFFTYRDVQQNQSALYWAASLEDEPAVLVDPNPLSEDGTVALSGFAASEDGKLLAYGLSSSGSDWQEWRVRDVDTGRDLDDCLEWVKFTWVSWTHDGEGFFYSRYDAPKEGAEYKGVNYYQKLYYHRVGTPQAEDELIYERPDQKEWRFLGLVAEDGHYLVIFVAHGSSGKNGLFYRDLQKQDSEFVELLNEFDAKYILVGNDGPLFYLLTDLDAPMSRVVAIDITKPGRSEWMDIIPESTNSLESVSLVYDVFIATYLHDARSLLQVFDKTGRSVGQPELPGVGMVSAVEGRQADQEAFYTFTSFTNPGTIFRYDIVTGQSTVFREPTLPFDPGAYETEQVFYASKDGTRVPMFISYKKGLKRDGKNPTLLFGYGGFGTPQLPRFFPFNLGWMEMGGIYAVANLRGGGEYGQAWHEAGTRLNKQNVFDDFIAAAEWLITNQYTSTSRLAIAGGSNGGLLVGACLTQRPDLFGACVAAVGVLDMLRFHKFTIGHNWISEYGSPEDPDEFEALLAYSPCHNVKPGTVYPPTIILTSDHDDRVFPAHSYKFVAALQAAQAGAAPVLIRIQTKAGHWEGKPAAMEIKEFADAYSFLAQALEPGDDKDV